MEIFFDPTAPWPRITNPRVILRFERHFVKQETGCWLWTGYCDEEGYGKFSPSIKEGQVPWKAHRVSWRIYVGPLPRGLLVLHECDIRPCVRPSHLWIGTQADNIQDAIKKGRLPWQKNRIVPLKGVKE